MINIRELKIGNFVVDIKQKKIIEIIGLSDLNIVEYYDNNGNRSTLTNSEIDPLHLNDNLMMQLVDHGVLSPDNSRKHVFYFPSNNTTYALLYDQESDEYYIGISATDHISSHSRVTRPFYEYHKLQNSYNVVYNKELKKIRI